MGSTYTHATTGHLDVSSTADGWDGRALQAEVTRAMESTYRRIAGEVGRVTAQLGAIAERLAAIESAPFPGGPTFHGAQTVRAMDKSTPLHMTGTPAGEQLRALEGLAGRIADPQAQVAVAAEMIRLQQQAGGMPPAQQMMPRAGRGWAPNE
jgi:hypothetical protein